VNRRTALATIPALLMKPGRLSLYPDKPPQEFVRAFRRDPAGNWREIVWEQICPGDEILSIGIFAGELHSIDLWTATSRPEGPAGATETSRHTSLLDLYPVAEDPS
jgi:hypothetical protein